MNQIIKKYHERYFIGLSLQLKPGVNNDEIPKLWHKLFNDIIPSLEDEIVIKHYIGLEEYDEDFMTTHELKYSAMVEVKNKIESDYYQQTLPKGTYVAFEIEFDDIMNEIGRVYDYVKKNKMGVSYAFDYEDYLPNQDYSKREQKLHFTLKLK